MDEQLIIPASEEAAAQKLEADKAALRAFVGNWTMETMPACDEGMKLLWRYAVANPTAYELALQRRFLDPPPMARTKLWQAFAEHASTCADCNER
jgi:hypothetical protein